MSIQKSSLRKGFAVAAFLGMLGFVALVIVLRGLGVASLVAGIASRTGILRSMLRRMSET